MYGHIYIYTCVPRLCRSHRNNPVHNGMHIGVAIGYIIQGAVQGAGARRVSNAEGIRRIVRKHDYALPAQYTKHSNARGHSLDLRGAFAFTLVKLINISGSLCEASSSSELASAT